MNMQIKDLMPGDLVESYFLAKSITLKTSTNNKPFLDLNCADKTGEINAKVWDYSKSDNVHNNEGSIIKVRGNVIEWQGNLQLKIQKIRLANKDDGIRVEDYVPSAPYKPLEMYDTLKNYIDMIENQDIKVIVEDIVKLFYDKLIFYPAAKSNHHSIYGGLLYHITTMLKLAESIKAIYPYLDMDLLIAGVILHDIAKIDEMDSNQYGIVSQYTYEGELLGHIIQGIKLIEKVGEKHGVEREIVVVLQHMVLSHHYEPDYGSPKRPMIPEAEILHYLDIIDARMYDMNNTLSSVKEKAFSDKIWTLNSRKLYKVGFNNKDKNK